MSSVSELAIGQTAAAKGNAVQPPAKNRSLIQKDGGTLFNVSNSEGTPNKVIIKPAPNAALTFGRNSVDIKSALQPLTKPFSSMVVEFETDYGRKSLGTIVSLKDGLIIGKKSELAGTFFCQIGEQKQPCKLLAFHRAHDLALVSVAPASLDGKTELKFREAQPPANTGSMVVSIGDSELPAALGIVSVIPTQFNIAQPKREAGIDLGVAVSRWQTTKKFQTDQGVKFKSGLEVQRVYPRSVAEQSGLLVGDLLQSLNNVLVTNQIDLKTMTQRLKVGQTIAFVVIRKGVSQTLTTKIQSFAPKTIHDRWGGGPFSEKRFGFSKVISHDSVIEPRQCGAPLVDLRGNVIGINISRSMRVATFAIPINDVKQFIDEVLPQIVRRQ